MSEENLRIVVLGSGKAHVEYEQIGSLRDGTQKRARQLVRELEAAERKLRRAMKKSREARGG